MPVMHVSVNVLNLLRFYYYKWWNEKCGDTVEVTNPILHESSSSMDSEVRASSCKFRPAGVGDLVAKIEEERLEVRASSCDFRQAAVRDLVAATKVERLEVRASS